MADQLGQESASAQGSRANLTLGLGLAALVIWIAAVILDEAGNEQVWMWMLMAGLGLAAVIAGFTSRRGQRPPGRALAGMVIGGLLVLMFLGFVIVDLVS